MPQHGLSDSETEETDSNQSSEELETPKNGGTHKMSEYEKQRAKRIEENRARIEALGLRKMASSVMDSIQKAKKRSGETKGKAKVVEEDEEYRPPQGEDQGLGSSSEEDDDDDDFVGGGQSSGSRRNKAKKKYSTPKKKVANQNFPSNSDFVDDDEALFQAIALSLKGSTECSHEGHDGCSRSSDAHLSERKGNAHIQEDTGKRKRKKLATSRVKMTEDELVIYFFQFDEAGKGSISLRDLRRLAAAHDFTWTEKEIDDMICCFDSDGDGKLSLDDFRKIVGQCNMIQVPERSEIGSNA